MEMKFVGWVEREQSEDSTSEETLGRRKERQRGWQSSLGKPVMETGTEILRVTSTDAYGC